MAKCALTSCDSLNAGESKLCTEHTAFAETFMELILRSDLLDIITIEVSKRIGPAIERTVKHYVAEAEKAAAKKLYVPR